MKKSLKIIVQCLCLCLFIICCFHLYNLTKNNYVMADYLFDLFDENDKQSTYMSALRCLYSAYYLYFCFIVVFTILYKWLGVFFLKRENYYNKRNIIALGIYSTIQICAIAIFKILRNSHFFLESKYVIMASEFIIVGIIFDFICRKNKM